MCANGSGDILLPTPTILSEPRWEQHSKSTSRPFVWIFYQDWYFPCNESYLARAVAVWCPGRQLKMLGLMVKTAQCWTLSAVLMLPLPLCGRLWQLPPVYDKLWSIEWANSEVMPVGSLVRQVTVGSRPCLDLALGVMNRSYISHAHMHAFNHECTNAKGKWYKIICAPFFPAPLNWWR